MWHVTCDMWHVTRGRRWTFPQNFSSLALTVWELEVTCDTWHVHMTCDMWHMTYEIWHVSGETQGVMNIVSKWILHTSVQLNFSSNTNMQWKDSITSLPCLGLCCHFMIYWSWWYFKYWHINFPKTNKLHFLSCLNELVFGDFFFSWVVFWKAY